MRSRTITLTLFTESTQPSQDPIIIIVSTLMHVVVLGIISFGIMYTPRVNNRALAKRYSVRLLEFHAQRSLEKPSAAKAAADTHTQNQTAQAAEGSKSSAASLLEHAKLAKTPQILLQPDPPPDVELPQETSIPMVMAWESQNFAPKSILANQQLPKIPHAQPSLDPPKSNLTIADISSSSTSFVTEKLGLLASSTSPLVVPGPNIPLQAPIIPSSTSGKSAPPPVVSISDLRMQDGIVALPFANQAPAGAISVRLATGASDGSQIGTGNGSGTGYDSGHIPSTERITPPPNGKYGVVVVGSSLEEIYPETADIWHGRMSYTVYLHVGLPQNWILQYSLPASAEASDGGNITHLEAPWPTDIVRPNFAPNDINADALMVHGFVNRNGRFEKLALIFPARFTLGQFLLNALQKWQFRPATQEGHSTAVEVLLIIPLL